MAPRLGADLPAHRGHRAARRLRPHLQPAALVAADARIVPVRHLLQPDRGAVRRRSPSRTGYPPSPIPDLSSGTGARCRRARSCGRPNPNDVDRATIQQMNVAVEQRLPVGHLGRARLRPHAHGRRVRRPRRQLLRARRRQGRPEVLRGGRHHADQRVGLAHQEPLPRPAGRAQPSVPERPAAEGRLHPEPVRERDSNDEDGWAGLTWNHPALLERNFALAGFDRTHVFQMGFVYELPFAKNPRASWAGSSRTGSSTASAPRTRARRSRSPARTPRLNCPGCGADARSTCRATPSPPARPARRPSPGTTSRSSRSPPARTSSRLRQQRAQPVPHSRRLERGPRALPLVPGRPLPAGDPHRGHQRVQPHQLGAGRTSRSPRPQFMTFAPTAAHQVEPDLGHGHPRADGARSASVSSSSPRSRRS